VDTGHYWAYCRATNDRRWYKYNDTITGAKCDKLPDGILNVNTVIYERIAVAEDDVPRTGDVAITDWDYVMRIVAASSRSSEASAVGGMWTRIACLTCNPPLGINHPMRGPRSVAERVRQFRGNQTDEQRDKELRDTRVRVATRRSIFTGEEASVSNEHARQRYVAINNLENGVAFLECRNGEHRIVMLHHGSR
jgi:hypothetical protein